MGIIWNKRRSRRRKVLSFHHNQSMPESYAFNIKLCSTRHFHLIQCRTILRNEISWLSQLECQITVWDQVQYVYMRINWNQFLISNRKFYLIVGHKHTVPCSGSIFLIIFVEIWIWINIHCLPIRENSWSVILANIFAS